MIGSIVSRLIIFVLGNLYPAYASFKAIKNKDVKEYVNWIIYWIAFAFFTFIETLTDVFLTWLPFYYELKTLAVIWLLSPATKGSLLIYREFLHPMLTLKEDNIDKFISETKDRGYLAIVQLILSSINCIKNMLMKTAFKTAQYTYKVTNHADKGAGDDENDNNGDGDGDGDDDVDGDGDGDDESFYVTAGSRSETVLKKSLLETEIQCDENGIVGHEAGDSRIIRSSSCNTFVSSDTSKISQYDKTFEEFEKEAELPERPIRKPRTRKSEADELKRNEKDRNGLPGIRSRN